jgi:hypothetical protein
MLRTLEKYASIRQRASLQYPTIPAKVQPIINLFTEKPHPPPMTQERD